MYLGFPTPFRLFSNSVHLSGLVQYLGFPATFRLFSNSVYLSGLVCVHAPVRSFVIAILCLTRRAVCAAGLNDWLLKVPCKPPITIKLEIYARKRHAWIFHLTRNMQKIAVMVMAGHIILLGPYETPRGGGILGVGLRPNSSYIPTGPGLTPKCGQPYCHAIFQYTLYYEAAR